MYSFQDLNISNSWHPLSVARDVSGDVTSLLLQECHAIGPKVNCGGDLSVNIGMLSQRQCLCSIPDFGHQSHLFSLQPIPNSCISKTCCFERELIG